jgi:hypothetical protein
MENIDIFYGHLKYFTDIRNILWPFGTFCVCLVHFFWFWCHVPQKSCNPGPLQSKVLQENKEQKWKMTKKIFNRFFSAKTLKCILRRFFSAGPLFSPAKLFICLRSVFVSVLPDNILKYQKSQSGFIWESLGMEILLAVWNILRSLYLEIGT